MKDKIIRWLPDWLIVDPWSPVSSEQFQGLAGFSSNGKIQHPWFNSGHMVTLCIREKDDEEKWRDMAQDIEKKGLDNA